jgi:hypothetical protein
MQNAETSHAGWVIRAWFSNPGRAHERRIHLVAVSDGAYARSVVASSLTGANYVTMTALSDEQVAALGLQRDEIRLESKEQI